MTGILLLWDRLDLSRRTGHDLPASGAAGVGLVHAIFGIIAILVGVQSLVMPN